MKALLEIKKQVEIEILEVKAKPTQWKSAIVDGNDDVEGILIPCRFGDCWCPIININTGVITNWKKGVTAEIYYKICDNGSYYLKDSEYNPLASIEEDYVPNILCPKSTGYGDYIIMDINENGQIKDWNPTLEGFEGIEEVEE